MQMKLKVVFYLIGVICANTMLLSQVLSMEADDEGMLPYSGLPKQLLLGLEQEILGLN